MVATEDRGFASMERNKQREIASKGGKAAHQKGTAHEWTSEEAREAGRKGGMASHRRKQEQQNAPMEPESGGSEPLGILDAHLLMVTDPMLIDRTRKRVHDELQNAEWALANTVKEIKAVLDAAEDDYFRERRSDVDFVGERIQRNLLGMALESPAELETLLRTYCVEHSVPEDWRQSVCDLLGVPVSTRTPTGEA